MLLFLNLKIIRTIIAVLLIIIGIVLAIKIFINLDDIFEIDDDFAPIAFGFGIFGLSLLVGFGIILLNYIWKLW